jgi:outer membrane lipoprotein-sorting protein
MKKAVTLGALVLLAIGLAPISVQAQTAKDVVEKMIEAGGGRKALAAIKDTTISGTIELLTMGMNGSLTMFQKEPDKMRIDIEVMGMVITQAFDGEKAWMTDPQSGTQQEMPEKQAQGMKRQALGNDSLLNPEKYGITYVLKGKEKIQDKEYFVLEQTYKDGEKATIYIDPATFLPYKSRAKSTDQMGAEVEAETIMADYKKVGDTTVAHSMTIFQGGTEFMRMTFSKVAYNTTIEDSFFKMSK